MKFKNANVQRWITLIAVALAGGVINKICYLRETYYGPLQEVTGASNAQLGMLMSAFGIANFLMYFPGGILADKFSPKKLIVFSCMSTALAGFWYATFPGFTALVIIHIIFAFTTVFTFWAAMVKIVNNLGSADEQGKMFGSLEALRGLFGSLIAFMSIPIFVRFGEGKGGLRGTIIFYSVALIVIGIIAAIFIVDPEAAQEQPVIKTKKEKTSGKAKWKDFITVAKIPRIWLCGIMVIANYSALIFHGMVTPYLGVAFGISASTVATLSVIRTYVMMSLGAVAAGLIADKMGSTIRFMQYGFIGMSVFSLGYILIPANRGAIWMIIINFIIYGMCLYSVKALYFATIDEVLIPKKLAGTASGIISLVGYAPEMFMYTLVGNIVDNAEGLTGYHTIFLCMTIFAIIGFASAILLRYLNDKVIIASKAETLAM